MLHRLQIITFDKLIEKERLKRSNRFKDQNTRLDSNLPGTTYQSIRRATVSLSKW